MTMRISATSLPEVLVIEPDVYADERGFLVQAFSEQHFAAAGLPTRFVLDNHSHSISGVVRGLHFQLDNPQGKLVTAITGEIFDVAVDIRVGSPTFGKWAATTLSASKPRFLWIPPGYAHGFAVLSDSADVTFKCTEPFHPDDQWGVSWDDPAIGIPWPIATPRLSAADKTRPLLSELVDALPRFEE
jgi:dTDP-4-dehydrorhamnose 3,5-epimerase